MTHATYYLTTDILGSESTIDDVAAVAAYMRSLGHDVVADETCSKQGAECPVDEDEFWRIVDAALGGRADGE